MVYGGMKCVKYVLGFFNLIFFLAGVALIVIGALVMTTLSKYVLFLGAHTNAAAILLIVVGSIIFVISFFGCCGAYKENHCMVLTFAVLMGIVLVLEIAAAIAAYVWRGQIQGYITDELKKNIDTYEKENHDAVTVAWNTAQKEFHCCGAKNYTDWQDNPKLEPDDAVPDSCCVTPETNCGKGKLDNPGESIYKTGCVSGMITYAMNKIAIIGAVALGLALIEVIGILIACCLARSIRKEYQVV